MRSKKASKPTVKVHICGKIVYLPLFQCDFGELDYFSRIKVQFLLKLVQLDIFGRENQKLGQKRKINYVTSAKLKKT